MVNEEAAETKTLDSASTGIFNVGMIMMILQFSLTYLLSTSLSFFWTLINSQINLVYLPLLSVNAPGQVSFYFSILIFVCTFDPVPVSILYEVMPIWAFDKLNMENDRAMFSRIGISDRNIINVMGSLYLFAVMFILIQSVY
jgi:hypothetical protein